MVMFRSVSEHGSGRTVSGVLTVVALAAAAAVVAALLFMPGVASAQSPPATPSSVSVTRADGSLTATWDAVFGATSYHVTYSSDGGASWSLAAFSNSNNSITISPVSNSSAYLVGVRAYNTAGWSGWRNSPSSAPYTPAPPYTPPTSPPASVAGISATRAFETLTASWTSVPTATHYHITYSDNGGGSWSLAAYAHPAAQNTTAITFGVNNSGTYIVAVRAWNAAGWSSWTNSAPSNPYYVNPPAFPPPAVSSIDLSRSGSSLTASWDAIGTASKYHVNYSVNGGASWFVAAGNHPAATPRTSIVISVDTAKTYVVAVRAGNNSGWSGWTNSSPSAPNSLSAPASATLSHNGSTLAASWDAVTGAATYYVEMRDGAGGNWLPVLVNQTGTSATITAPNHRSSYQIRVQARTAGGDGSPWAESSMAHPSMQPPATPYWLKLSRTGYNTVQAAWNDVPNKTGYTIEYSGDGWATSSSATIAAADSAAFFNMDLTKTWVARVKATNVYGSSPWKYSGALAPPQLTAEGFLDYAELKFSNFGGSWYYKANVGPHATCQGPVTGGSLTVSGLANATEYTYAVYDNENCSVEANESLNVSNLGETAHSTRAIVGRYSGSVYSHASAFTTGSHSTGYTLQSATISVFGVGGSPTGFNVAIHAVSGGNPASNATYTLTGTSPTGAGDVTYSCSGTCRLAANTTYFLVMTATTPASGDHYYTVDRTSSDSETNTPSSAGWSIANAYKWKASGSQWSTQTDSYIHQFKVTAVPYSPPAVAGPVGFTTLAPLDFLTASNVGSTSATLNMDSYYTGVNWYYRQHGYNNCVEVSGSSAGLTGLTAKTLYGYTAYRHHMCLSAFELGRTNFTTADAGVGNLTNLLDGGCVFGKPGGSKERQCAAAFTTGSSPNGGYFLHSITVQLGIDSGGTVSNKVALHAADASGLPAAQPMATLNGSYSKARGSYTFTCLNTGVCNLASNTTYFVVVSAPHAAYNFWRHWETRNSGQEYRWPNDQGWAIDGGAMYRVGSGEWKENAAAGKTPVFHVAADTSNATLAAQAIQTTQVSLRISGHTGAWYFNSNKSPYNTTCTAISNGDRIDATGLAGETHYVFTAYNDSSCTTPIASTQFTTLRAASLTATVQSDDTVYLTLSNGPADWWFRIGHGCHATSGNRYPTTGGIAGYTGTHTVTAYSDNSCSTQIATATFTV